MVSMYTITQYISNICFGIQQRSRVRPEKPICSHFPFISLDIPANIGHGHLGYQFHYALA